MTGRVISLMGLGVLALATLVLFVRTSALRQECEKLENERSLTRDSLALVHQTLDSLRGRMPGLGEYMSTIQLHAAKLWFAEHSSHWRLANYELDELEETVEAAEALHARKNGVEVSTVLKGIQQTQLAAARRALENKNGPASRDAYLQLLSACNGCHRAAGYEFIRIITPTREPVTNQDFSPGGERAAPILSH